MPRRVLFAVCLALHFTLAASSALAQSRVCLLGTTLDACPGDAVARERSSAVPTARLSPEPRTVQPEVAPPAADFGALGTRSSEDASDQLVLREVTLLGRLAHNLDPSAPNRPAVLMRLAEMAAEAARRVDTRMNQRLGALHSARQAGQRSASARLTAAQRRDAEALRRHRQTSIEAWARLIREHPGHRDEDQALHAFALMLSESGDASRAATVWRELVRRHPGSRLVPFAWVGLGEAALARGDGAVAMGLFERAIAFGPGDNPLYVFALHRKGWSARVSDDPAAALAAFVRTLEAARAHPEQLLADVLAAQAARDLIAPYAAVGAPNRALPFFRRLVGDQAQALGMLRQLAAVFHDEGRWAESLTLHHRLIREEPAGEYVCGDQERVLRAVIASGDESAQVREVQRLADLAVHLDDAGCRALAGASAAELAVAWHRESVGFGETPGTRSTTTMARAVQLYALIEGLEDFDALPMPRFDRRDRPTHTSMRYFQAELLLALERWQGCGEAFSDVVRVDPAGAHGPDAARGAVLCFDRLLATRSASRELGSARTLSALEEDMVAAFRRYRCAVPDAEDLATVLYREGRVFLDAGHLEEAAARFAEVARRFPDSAVGEFAANLHLAALEEIGVRDPTRRGACVSAVASSLRPYHHAYCVSSVGAVRETGEAAHGGLCRRLGTLGCSVGRHNAQLAGERGDHARAAEIYHGLAGRAPACDRRDEILLNLAIHAQAADLVGRAIAALEALVDEHPRSRHVTEAHRKLGEAYHAIAIYDRAAEHHEAFARRAPRAAEAADALANAVFFYLGLGHDDRALAAARFFEDRLSHAHPEEAAQVAFSAGTVYERRANHRAVVTHYRLWIGRHAEAASPARIVEAHAAIGRAHHLRGDERAAGLAYSAAVRAWESLGPRIEALPGDERPRVLREASAAAAEATFGEADALYQRFRDSPFPAYRSGSVAHWTAQSFRPWLDEQLALLARAEAAFERVGPFGDPRWTIAALARTGEMYARFADAFADAPVPSHIARDPDAYAVYVDELERQRRFFSQPAIQRFSVCLGMATELRFFDDQSQRCEHELARLNPRMYRLSAELRGGMSEATVAVPPRAIIEP